MEAAIIFVVLALGLWIPLLLGLAGEPAKQRSRWQAGFGELVDERLPDPPLDWSLRLGGYTAIQEGRLGGRLVRLALRAQLLRYQVQLAHDPGRLRLSKQDLSARAAGKQADELRGALDHLFGVLGFTELRVEDGWLVVERPHTEYALGLTSLRGVFAHLTNLAPLLEVRELNLKVAGVRGGRGWTAGGAGILCPYCRDEIPVDEPALSACEHCHTIHHTECLTEAGGCTVLGCEGRPRARRETA